MWYIIWILQLFRLNPTAKKKSNDSKKLCIYLEFIELATWAENDEAL